MMHNITMAKDTLFNEANPLGDFNFGEDTAEVFDDMLLRSVPLYPELQRMTGELANEFAIDESIVYDLGCSTGTTLATLDAAIEKKVTLIGVDKSAAMLKRARDRLTAQKSRHHCLFQQHDLDKPIDIKNASVVILNLTLQFIRPLKREQLVKNIYNGLHKNGCLILVEKVLGNDSLFNREFIKFYYALKKRNGYSDMEIARKRETLENILIPYRVNENTELLEKSGFEHVDIFFKWYNFCGFLAVK